MFTPAFRTFLRTVPGPNARRSFTISVRHPSSFTQSPSPPRLPKEEQEAWEELQARSTGAFSTPTSVPTRPQTNQSPASTNASRMQVNQSPASSESGLDARIESTGKGEELHPDIRRGAKPEFEGDQNPKTGETGGPKNEPLRWGHAGDWSYNGRVTDF
ncbi:DUF1674-domain-containing protein [Aulographum hederae CBS 113979]|uniref:Succinate dehydrogenase assembly factor 4, mitochondrial n=1 Tax=Aulographum hederae CBS 113979 TaxID=1176131 RepID=A0A6G1HEU0_9PEZI|nr:DUF1674-domain-containing protein [Aulographum hederae CBS 113979]